MTNDIYKTPSAELEENRPNQTSSFKAILWGLFVDIGGTTIFVTLFFIAFATLMWSQGLSESQINENITGITPFSLLGVFLTVVGTIFSFLGGYICTRKNLDKSNKNIVILILIIGIYCLVPTSESGILIDVILTAITVVAIYLGHVYAKRNIA